MMIPPFWIIIFKTILTQYLKLKYNYLNGYTNI